MIEQIAIACTGLTAIFLSQSREPFNRYACMFGLAGQPFWFYSAYTAQQWGIFILCIFYTFAWAKGVNTYWIQGKTIKTKLSQFWDRRAKKEIIEFLAIFVLCSMVITYLYLQVAR